MAKKKKDDGYIRFNCRMCGKRLKVRETFEGGDVLPCPKCGSPVSVPIGDLGAMAEAANMAETGAPGKLNVDPERLMAQLRGGDEDRDGPGSAGGPPTVGGAAWSGGTSFARITELDQLSAAIHKVNEDIMGQAQRIYRTADVSPEDREAQMREIGQLRRQDLLKLLKNQLEPMRDNVRRMEAQHQRLSREEWTELDKLKLACEALALYAEHVLGVPV